MGNRKRRGRGEGSIYQEASGRWVGVVSLGYPDGKRRRRKVTGKTKAEVQTRLRQLHIDTGRVDATQLTVGEYLDRWLSNAAPERASAKTLEQYCRVVNQQLRPAIGNLRLADLSAVHVEDCYGTLKRQGVGPGARRKAASVLRAALRHAVRMRIIPSSPTSGVAPPKATPREIRPLANDEARRFLEAARRRTCYPLLATALGTGMRRGELLALAWEDVDLDAGRLTVHKTAIRLKGELVLKEPKTKAGRRKIALPAFVAAALRNHRVNQVEAGFGDRPVFCNKVGRYRCPRDLTPFPAVAVRPIGVEPAHQLDAVPLSACRRA